jgi:hypothetical protein
MLAFGCPNPPVNATYNNQLIFFLVPDDTLGIAARFQGVELP